MRWAFGVALLVAQPAGWKAPALRIQQGGALRGYVSTLNCSTGTTCTVGGSSATITAAGGGGGTTAPGGVSGNLQANVAGAFGAYAGASCAYAVKTLDANGAASCTAAPTIPTPSGTGAELQIRATGTTFGTYAGTSCAYAMQSVNTAGVASCQAAPTIPADISAAHYVTTQAEAGLSAEAVLPTCAGTDKLTFNGTAISCATDQTGGGTVAGSTTQVIYNNAGAYAGNTNFTFDQTAGQVGIGAPTFLTNNPFGVAGTVNGFLQAAIQNKSAGTLATSDWVATADTGTNTANFIDMGINSSLYADTAYTINGPLDGYLFSNGGNISLGTATAAKTIKFHTGGTLAANLRATISDTALNLASGVALQANGSSGVSGQVLTSAGAASPTWTTPSGGGPAKLCGFRFGSAAATSGAVTCTAAEAFFCMVNVASYSGGGDIASLRFNADATAANYHARHINFSNAATPVLTSTNFTTGGVIQLGPVAITAGRSILIRCSNVSSVRKVCTIHQQEEATAQATMAQMEIGYGEWFNTSAQVISIEMRTNGGSVTMGVGSGFVCYGGTPP